MNALQEQAAKKIIIALDYSSLDEALPIAMRFKGKVGGLKAAQTLLTAEGPDRVAKALSGMTDILFGDFKYHDIPFQVGGAVANATALGFNMINVHASGGSKMMIAAAEAAQEKADKLGIAVPTVIAVTVLTSLNYDALVELGDLPSLNIADPEELADVQKRAIERLVRYRALLAQDCGLSGVVASPIEVPDLRQNVQEDFLIVTPGIRLPTSSVDDQVRLSTPEVAVANGSSYLVVGRDFTTADDPDAVLEEYTRRIVEISD